MSSLTNINLQPRLIPYLIRNRSFSEKPLIIVDVGSRGGYESHWNLFGDQIKILGFDPDEKECKRLNRQIKKVDVYHYPYALWEKNGIRDFYLMSNPSAYSFFRPKYEFWVRLPDIVNFKFKKTIKVKTVTFDSFTSENNIDYVDFIKLDIEGAELKALKGAKRILKDSVLGVTCEVVFDELLLGESTFSDVDIFLRSLGFKLFDLGLFRKLRKTVSAKPTLTPTGQVITGHALYFRDGFEEIRSFKLRRLWGRHKVLKLAALMELFGLADCAVELLTEAKAQGLFNSNDYNNCRRLLIKTLNTQSKKLRFENWINSIIRN